MESNSAVCAALINAIDVCECILPIRRLRCAVPILDIKAIALRGQTPLRKADAAVRGMFD